MMTHTHYSNHVFLCFFETCCCVTMHQNSNNICPGCKHTDSRTSNACLDTPDGWQQCKFNIAVIIIFTVFDSLLIITVSVVGQQYSATSQCFCNGQNDLSS